MAIHVSPGVYWKEIDQSNYIPQLSTTIAAIVGTASKGPINTRTFVSTIDRFIQTFGTPSADHLGAVAALEYLSAGNQLWYTRVESTASPAQPAKTTGTGVVWTAKDPGSFYNGYNVSVTYGLPRNLPTIVTAHSTTEYTISFGHTHVVPGSVTLKVGTVIYKDDGQGKLVVPTGAPALANSQVDYKAGTVHVTFQATPTSDLVTTGQYYTAFNVTVSRKAGIKTVAVEDYSNMNLVEGTENYYKTRMQFTNFLVIPDLTDFPDTGDFVMSGGTDGIEGITPYDYIGKRDIVGSSGLQAYAVPEEVDINVIACPGQSDIAIRQALIDVAENRKDTIALLDPPQGVDIDLVVDWADGVNSYSEYNAVNSTYSAIYYAWYRYTDAYNSTSYWAPPSGLALMTYARSEYWEAPAGPNRGTMQGVTKMERPLTQGDRDFLYANRINPITDLPGYGIIVFGQKTGTMYPTALDRVAARRTLIIIEKAVTTALFPLLFEPNNILTWKRVERLIQPYLDYLVTAGRIYEGRVICDSTTNTPTVIDQNQLVVIVFLKLMKYAEQIMVNFVLVPTGANIDEYVGQAF